LIRVGVKSRRYYDNQAQGLVLFMNEFGERLAELNPQGAALNWLVLGHAQAMLGQCGAAWQSSLRGVMLNGRDLRVLRNGISLLKCLVGVGLAK
jgi:hypothetical protein